MLVWVFFKLKNHTKCCLKYSNFEALVFNSPFQRLTDYQRDGITGDKRTRWRSFEHESRRETSAVHTWISKLLSWLLTHSRFPPPYFYLYANNISQHNKIQNIKLKFVFLSNIKLVYVSQSLCRSDSSFYEAIRLLSYIKILQK